MEEFLNSGFGQVLIQLIGFFAMMTNVLSFQARRRANILIIQSTGSLIWLVQFMLLGGVTGAIMNFFAMLRNIIYSQKDKHKALSSPLVTALFAVLCLGLGVYSFTLEGWRSLLPSTAMLIATVAFSFKREFVIRILSLFIGPLWLVYDAISFSIAGMLCEILSLMSIATALIRFDKNNQPRRLVHKKVE